MKVLLVALSLVAFLLSGCFGKVPVAPGALPPTEIIKDTVAVPVTCKETVQLVDSDADGLATEQTLEEKVFRLTRSDAQNRVNLARLKAAALKCGVTILAP